jgi:hypothetical protein
MSRNAAGNLVFWVVFLVLFIGAIGAFVEGVF